MFIKSLKDCLSKCNVNSRYNTLYAPKRKRIEWKCEIGLEVHVQLLTKSKLFSSGPNKYKIPPNSGVNLFDAAIPGTLPVLNKRAVELAALASFALNCEVNPISMFDRKHYFYPDMPNGYQITQQRMPLAQNGIIEFTVPPPPGKSLYIKTARIKQIQLEQDSGKSLHDVESGETLIDLNRAGIPLIEIVFEPDLYDPEEAGALLKDLCAIFRKCGISSCKMEEGAVRVDANVSVRREGEELGVRTEIKNIGSIRGVVHAANQEVARQIRILERGGKILNQTLGWDAIKREVVVLRDKEEYHDYRFMPEPNLPPLRLIVDENSNRLHERVKNRDSILDVRHLKKQVPMLPQQERKLIIDKYNASGEMAYDIVNIPKLHSHFMNIMNENPERDVKSVHNVLLITYLTTLHRLCRNLGDCDLPSSILGELADARVDTLTEKGAQVILRQIMEGSGLSVKELINEKNLTVLTDDEIRTLCLDVIDNEPNILTSKKIYKNKVNYILSRVMARSEARAKYLSVLRIVDLTLQEKGLKPDERKKKRKVE